MDQNVKTYSLDKHNLRHCVTSQIFILNEKYNKNGISIWLHPLVI
jgi:hypothetical protein